MKNTAFADQSGMIRTLTEEEVTVVSGGGVPWQVYNNRILAEAARFRSRPTSYYVPKGPLSATQWRNNFLPVIGMFYL